VLKCHNHDLFNADVLLSKAYHFSDSTVYYVPDCGNVHSIRDYISSLPLFDRPEAFGQHMNANVLKQIAETNKMTETLMLTKPQVSSMSSTRDQKVLAILADMVKQLPVSFAARVSTNGQTATQSPVRIAVAQEVVRYNALLKLIAESMENVEQAIRGTALITADLEQIANAIYEGRVPSAWLRFYPSVKQLGFWVRDLVQRIAYFRDFVEGYFKFWLKLMGV
jgi:dynein heavy chain